MPPPLSTTPPSCCQSDTPPVDLHHTSTMPPPLSTTPPSCCQSDTPPVDPRSPTPPSLSHHSPSLLHHSSLSSGTATSTRCILNCTDHKAEGGSSPSSLRWQRCRFGKPYLLCLRLRKAGTGTGVSSSLVPRRVFLDIV